MGWGGARGWLGRVRRVQNRSMSYGCQVSHPCVLLWWTVTEFGPHESLTGEVRRRRKPGTPYVRQKKGGVSGPTFVLTCGKQHVKR